MPSPLETTRESSAGAGREKATWEGTTSVGVWPCPSHPGTYLQPHLCRQGARLHMADEDARLLDGATGDAVGNRDVGEARPLQLRSFLMTSLWPSVYVASMQALSPFQPRQESQKTH